MKTGFLRNDADRTESGRETITNAPAPAGLIPKNMMKKFTLFSFLMLMAVVSLFAQVPGPITTAGQQILPTSAVPVPVTVPLTVDNFTNVTSLSLTLNFDPAVLTFSSETHDPALVGLLSVVPDNINGILTIGWFGANIPLLNNGTHLFDLNFIYVGSGTSLITFNDPTGIECEYTDNTTPFAVPYLDTPKDTYYKAGFVTDLNATATYTNQCLPGNVGVITITAAGGTGSYEYSIDGGATWVAGASPYSFTGLAPGAYLVQVRDVLLATPLATITVGTLAIPVHNVTQNTYYCTIQAAINAANTSDIIQASPWTYVENVTVNKSVTITGLNTSTTFIDGNGSGTVVNITANNVLFEGFTVQNSGSVAGDAGILIGSGVTGAQVQYNLVTGNENGISLINANGNIIQLNEVTGNNNGFYIGTAFNTNTIYQNQIYGNTMGMVASLTNPLEQVAASLNWWGDATGPYNNPYNTCGLGNGVTGNVIFQPWYTTSGMTTTATLPVKNFTDGTYYCTIQDAVNDASNNDVIHLLASGSYGSLVYNFPMNLEIKNMSSGTATMVGTGSALTVSAGVLKLDGIDLTTAANFPTIDVSAGKLIIRNCNVFESTGFVQTGILVSGGELDAGTSAVDYGHNRILSDGTGLSINNTGGVVNAIANHWGSNFYMVISPKIVGSVPFDPWCNYDFTFCGLSRFGGPITYAPKVITSPGAVTLLVTVDQFANVDAISLTLDFDPAVLTFTGFTPNPAFSSMTVLNPTSGQLVIGWFNSIPVTTLADGSTVVALNFTFNGGTSLLLWNDLNAIDCEYQNALIQYPYIDQPQGNFYYDGWITDLDATGVTTTNVVCKGTASGTITVNGSTGGSGTYEYSADGGLTWQSSNVFYVIAGTYDVWIRDAAFPFIKVQVAPVVVITEPAVALSATANWTKRVRCKGESNGKAMVYPVGGWGNYTYLWSDPAAQTTQEATGLAAGLYFVTVTDMGGCSVVASTYVIEPVTPFTASAVQSQVVSCKGGSNGAITVSAAHGWGYYMYSIDNITYYNYLTTQTITGLPAGNYTVHIFDDERCELWLPVTIQEPAIALSATAAETKSVSCYGYSDGEATVYPVGGWGSYQFSLDGTNYQVYSGNVITGLAAGTYTVYVKDLNNCVVTTTVTITQPGMLTGLLSGNNTICSGDPSTVTVAITGGTAPFDFVLFDGVNTHTVLNHSTNSYSFTQNYTASTTWSWQSLTDANSCTSTTSGTAVINVNPLPVISFGFNGVEAGWNASFAYCYDQPVGVTLHTAYVGTAPYTVTFEVNGVTSTVSGLNTGSTLVASQLYAPGVYNIVVTDITDNNGCHADPAFLALCTATVTINDEPMVSFGFNGVEAGWNASFEYCYNVPVGVTLYNYYGGTAPYSVTYTVNGGTPVTVNNLYQGDPLILPQVYAAGQYSIVVTDITDANNCHASTSFLSYCTATVTILEEPMVSFGFNGVEAGHNASFGYCYNEQVGVTLYGIYGGDAPFSVTYEVNGVTNTVTGLTTGGTLVAPQIYAPGVYNIVVTNITDDNGCVASPAFLSLCTATVTIHDEPMVSFGFNGVEAGHNASFQYCYNEQVGVTLYNVYGGTAPYEVTFEVNGVTTTVTGLGIGGILSAPQLYAPGVYNVVVTKIKDVYGCEASSTFLSLCTATITIHDEPMISFGFNGVEAGHNAAFEYCYDQQVGVTLYNVYGGTAPYEVTYEVNGVTSTVAGLYIGGTISAPQLYAPGIYNVVVTKIKDVYGCEASAGFLALATATITIHEEPMISFGFNGVEAGHNAAFTYCYDQPVGVTLYGIYGGTAPYSVTYTVNGGSPITVTNLGVGGILSAAQLYAPGVYNIVVTNITDAEGCQASTAFLSLCTATITIKPEPAVGFSFNGVLAGTGSSFDYCYTQPVTVTMSDIWSGTAPFNISWTVDDGTGPVTSSASNVMLNGTLFSNTLAPGTYTVQITSIVDAFGCSPASYAPYVAYVTIHKYNISGYYYYHNSAETPLNNISITLMQGSSTIANDISEPDGYYEFNGVCPGTYEVTSSTVKPVGGINSTDAVQVNGWGISPTPIEKVRFKAGDVIVSNTVNSADAGRILQYFVTTGIPPFSGSAWAFWKAGDLIGNNPMTDGANPVITVTTADVVQNFYGLVAGDFNRSFTPNNAKTSGSVSLTTKGSVLAASGEVVELPVRAGEDMDISAISLVMNYPADKVEVTGVTLGDANGVPVMFSAENGELRIAFASLNPLMLQEGDAMVTLKLRALPALTTGESVVFTMAANPLNELAGSDLQPLTSTNLWIAVVEGTVGELEIPAAGLVTLGSMPNPFRDVATLRFAVPSNGHASLEVYDLVGRKVVSLYDGDLAAGYHTADLNGQLINPGVYLVSLRFSSAESTEVRTIRVVKN